MTEKMVFVLGDFNIDLLNPNENKTNRDFMDIMYNLCLIPTIIKPTIITRGSVICVMCNMCNVM